MSINNLYHTPMMQIQKLRPTERKTRIQNLAWLISGIHQSLSACLNRIARKIAGKAKLLSVIYHLS